MIEILIMNNKTYKFRIRGMHCKSCELMTESELKEFSYVSDVKASLKSNLVLVTGDFKSMNPSEVAEDLNKVLIKHNYTLSPDIETKFENTTNWSEFYYAIPFAILFVIFYIFLQKIGLVNLLNVKEVSFGNAFIIGIIASLSSCMAVVGGLVLSISTTFAREGNKVFPQTMFHISRIISFFILGGMIGALGSVFRLNTFSTFILGFLVAIVMLILGINLLDIFPWVKKLQFGIPKFLSKYAFNVSKLNHTLTPILIGIASFFLPCGFTQSMQIYTLSTGSFFEGAMVMFSFALGTLPVLLMFSFSSFSITGNKNKGIFWKTAGLVVILFALFNLINALVVINILPPVFNF